VKLSKQKIKELIIEAVNKPNYDVNSFIFPKTHVDISNPGAHAEMAIAHLERIIEEISQVPENNLKKYTQYLADQKLPQVILEIKKTGMIK
jgi:hypothetical protein